MKTSFFTHVAMEFALRNGWDFEANLIDFWKGREEELTSICYEVVVTGEYKEQYGELVKLTEADILLMSQGKYNQACIDFWTYYSKIIKPEVPDNATVLQSMHSGSSDMLFVSDIKAMVTLFENVPVV